MSKELIKRTDVGLYITKAQGRNRIVRAEDITVPLTVIPAVF